ncbi:MAG: DUF3120 domain-containing protein [Xenococcaceae cyanobacterium]
MFNNSLLPQTPSSKPEYEIELEKTNLVFLFLQKRIAQPRLVFFASSFLVSVPVFFQAPLVRFLPGFSLLLTAGWVMLGFWLLKDEKTKLWGDLLLGFSWSWLAGSIYWGWLRDNPVIHIPVEAIGLPFAIWCLWRGWGIVGNFFYIGSLLGTAITDLYFWLTDLIPYWRQVMQAEPELVSPILKAALAQIETLWGVSWAVILVNFLLGISLWSWQKEDLHWRAFTGAVFSTLLVDGLFWLTASLI